MDYHSCYKIHGISKLLSDFLDSDSDSGKEDFDDLYERHKPPPLHIDPRKHKIHVIRNPKNNIENKENNAETILENNGDNINVINHSEKENVKKNETYQLNSESDEDDDNVVAKAKKSKRFWQDIKKAKKEKEAKFKKQLKENITQILSELEISDGSNNSDKKRKKKISKRRRNIRNHFHQIVIAKLETRYRIFTNEFEGIFNPNNISKSLMYNLYEDFELVVNNWKHDKDIRSKFDFSQNCNEEDFKYLSGILRKCEYSLVAQAIEIYFKRKLNQIESETDNISNLDENVKNAMTIDKKEVKESELIKEDDEAYSIDQVKKKSVGRKRRHKRSRNKNKNASKMLVTSEKDELVDTERNAHDVSVIPTISKFFDRYVSAVQASLSTLYKSLCNEIKNLESMIYQRILTKSDSPSYSKSIEDTIDFEINQILFNYMEKSDALHPISIIDSAGIVRMDELDEFMEFFRNDPCLLIEHLWVSQEMHTTAAFSVIEQVYSDFALIKTKLCQPNFWESPQFKALVNRTKPDFHERILINISKDFARRNALPKFPPFMIATCALDLFTNRNG